MNTYANLVFTSNSAYTFFVGGAPLPQAAKLVKCVVAQHEDMSEKADIGRVKLEVWLRDPVFGTCQTRGAAGGYLFDDSPDTKHMVAFRASSGVVGGKCAHVRLTANNIPTSGYVWTQAYCYAADEEDDEPN